jgi:hypothetical protein
MLELIHFCSRPAVLGCRDESSSGRSRNCSAKCSLINLRNGGQACLHHGEKWTHLESSVQPPPTRTMTVCERKIRQKHSLGSCSPIQYLPLWSFHESSATVISMLTGSLLTTSPTAMSSLFFGLATYLRLGAATRRVSGRAGVLEARAHEDLPDLWLGL